MTGKIVTLACCVALGFAQSAAYILCEGNFMVGNSSLWQVTGQEILLGVENNPLGDTGQSLCVYEHKLYAILNGTGTIEVFQIQTSGDLAFEQSVDLNFSGPREMTVINGRGYITEWYLNDIAILDISTLTIVGNIPVEGLPEDIIWDGSRLYVSLTMNMDWSSAHKILVIDPETESVIDEYEVADGPGPMVLANEQLYVSSTYYDANWNTYAATSKIDLVTGNILINDYGQTPLFGTDIIFFQGDIYRIYNNGIIALDDALSPIPDSYLGEFPGLYSMDIYQNHIYLGLSNFVSPDEVRIIDFAGVQIASFSVGAIPGSFAFYPPLLNCDISGDVNHDLNMDILDLVKMISHILGMNEMSEQEVCASDSNEDGFVDVTDIVYWVDQILVNP